jgi:hypothetical protein
MSNESSAAALRVRAPRRITVHVSRGALLSGFDLQTCPLCGSAPAADRVLVMLRWPTRNARRQEKQDAEQAVNIRVPTCAPCRRAHEAESRPGARRVVDVLSGLALSVGLGTWIYVDGVVWQWNLAAVAFGALAPLISRWLFKRTGTGRALEVARVRGNVVELEAPESLRQVLAEEYPAALNVEP